MAAIEWTYPRLVDLAAAAPMEPGETRTTSARGGIDGYNARQVAKRSRTAAAELVAEFRRNRAATIAAVAATDEAVFVREVRSAGGREGTLARVYHEVAVEHVRGHLRDILGR